MLDNVIQKLRERFDPFAFCNEIQTFTQLEDIDRLQLLKFQILAGKWRYRFCRFKDIDTHQTEIAGADDSWLRQDRIAVIQKYTILIVDWFGKAHSRLQMIGSDEFHIKIPFPSDTA